MDMRIVGDCYIQRRKFPICIWKKKKCNIAIIHTQCLWQITPYIYSSGSCSHSQILTRNQYRQVANCSQPILISLAVIPTLPAALSVLSWRLVFDFLTSTRQEDSIFIPADFASWNEASATWVELLVGFLCFFENGTEISFPRSSLLLKQSTISASVCIGSRSAGFPAAALPPALRSSLPKSLLTPLLNQFFHRLRSTYPTMVSVAYRV